ncbi:MAG: acyl carrier protein [Nannocystaceae bacterium]|nr:acyl carrier protein [Nannocystaceae bacterium]
MFALLSEKMSEMFELEKGSLKLETHLFKELDLDSIDAIDLAVHLQEYTGKKVEEEKLRDLQTVGDVVNLILKLQAT